MVILKRGIQHSIDAVRLVQALPISRHHELQGFRLDHLGFTALPRRNVRSTGSTHRHISRLAGRSGQSRLLIFIKSALALEARMTGIVILDGFDSSAINFATNMGSSRAAIGMSPNSGSAFVSMRLYSPLVLGANVVSNLVDIVNKRTRLLRCARERIADELYAIMRRFCPYRGENPGPGKDVLESLTTGPELENSQGQGEELTLSIIHPSCLKKRTTALASAVYDLLRQDAWRQACLLANGSVRTPVRGPRTRRLDERVCSRARSAQV